jgi:hypothetical protein
MNPTAVPTSGLGDDYPKDRAMVTAWLVDHAAQGEPDRDRHTLAVVEVLGHDVPFDLRGGDAEPAEAAEGWPARFGLVAAGLGICLVPEVAALSVLADVATVAATSTRASGSANVAAGDNTEWTERGTDERHHH